MKSDGQCSGRPDPHPFTRKDNMATDFPAFETIDGDFSKGLLIVCDHARNALPAEYGTLGLPVSEFERHIAYDIGAEALTRGLAEKLQAPAVMATYSRLLIDPNRGADDPTLVRQLYDGTVIPGNYPLPHEELRARIERYHAPYHRSIEAAISRFAQHGQVPAILAVHTMTDKWNGETRPWHASILWDMDPRFSIAMLDELGKLEGLTIGDNQPYDGALAGDTMSRHGTANGLAHALLEIRQDLVRTGEGVEEWVERLAPIVEKINADPHNHEKQFFGTRTGMELPMEHREYHHG